MNKVFWFVLFFFISISAFFSVNVHAEGPYTVGIIGNISDRLYSGKANVMWIGDSISVESLPQRYLYGVLRTWYPEQWKGVFFTWATSSGSGAAVLNEQFVSNSTFITPGAPYPDGTLGWNIQDTRYYNFTGDLVNFTTFASPSLLNSHFSSWAQDWTNNSSLTMRLLYVSDQNSVYLNYNSLLRNGTVASGLKPAYFNDSQKGIYYKDIYIPASTGNSSVGAVIATNNANEKVMNKFYPLGFGIYRNDITTGLQWGPNTGSGSWNTLCHIQGCNLSYIFTGRNYTDNYTDYSIRQYINATDANIFFIHISNPAVGELNGSGYLNESYTSHILTIIDRYLNAYYAVKPNTQTSDRPYFVFLSAPDRSDGDVTRLMMEQALEAIVRNQSSYPNIAANTTLGLIKLRQNLNDTLGTWSNWQGTYTDDGTHQNFAGAILFANRTWIEIMNARTPIGGLMGNWGFNLDSSTITETYLDENAVLFKNTDIYTQNLALNDVNNMLVYASNGGVYCSDVVNCDGSLNIDLPKESYVYALNNFNLTENLLRANSPLWISESSVNGRRVSSSLSDGVNVDIVFSVPMANLISSIDYYPANSPVVHYYRSDFKVSGNKIILVAPVDSGLENDFVFNWNTFGCAVTGCTSAGRTNNFSEHSPL